MLLRSRWNLPVNTACPRVRAGAFHAQRVTRPAPEHGGKPAGAGDYAQMAVNSGVIFDKPGRKKVIPPIGGGRPTCGHV